MKLLDSADKLKSWEDYREYLKDELKRLDGEVEAYVSKDKLAFDIEGKPWRGHAFLAGKRAIQSVQKLKKDGVIFRVGTCTKNVKELQISGFKPVLLMKEVKKTFLKLRLGYTVTVIGGEDEEGEAGAATEGAATAGAATGELAQQADKITKAVMIWDKTVEAATKELRKLQKAILALKDPRGTPVIKGLESILTRLDKVDDEANAAAGAARRGDQQAFAQARRDLLAKMKGIRDYVQTDELIADADRNPGVQIQIRQTITNSLDRLMKAF